MSFRAALAATGIVIWLAFLSGAAQGIGTSERDYWFSPVDRPQAQQRVPALDSPNTTWWSPSSLAGRGAIAIALGRRTAPRDLAAAANALAIGLMGCWLIAAGMPRFPVLLVMLGIATGSTFWWRGVYWTFDTLSPALAMLSAWAAVRWSVTRRDAFLIVAGVAATLALVDDPTWLAAAPAIGGLLRERTPERTERRKASAAFVIPVLAGGVALRFKGLPPIMQPGAWSFGAATNELSQAFTPLGLVLVLVGAVVSWRVSSSRTTLGLLFGLLIVWQWGMPNGSIEPIIMPLVICGWASIGVALWWLRETLNPRAGAILVATLGLVLVAGPGLTRARLSALGKDRASEEQARIAYNFKFSDLPAGSALVAESRRVDSTVRLAAERAGTTAIIIPQDPAQLNAAIGEGTRVFAFPHARANLAPLGFLFERAFAGNTAVSAVAGQVECARLKPGESTDVSLLLARGSFIVHPADLGGAPGGVALRLSGAEPGATAIEPRSIKYEMTGDTLRIPETGRRSPVTFVFEHAPWAATATLEGPTPATICPGVSQAELTIGSRSHAAAQLKMTANVEFGPGWHSPEADPDYFRWTAAERASIRVSVGPAGPIHVTITATPAARPAMQPHITLAVNACALPSQPMTPSQGDYEWDVAANCWRTGLNQLWLGITPLVSPQMLTGSHDTRMLGARIGAVRLARQ